MGIELDLLNAIQTIHTPALDNIMCGITRLGNGGVFWLSLGLLLLLKPSKVRAGLILFIAIGLEVLLCNGLLKHLFCRVRPCDVNTAIQLLIARPKDYSFPSGHTAVSFAAVAAFYFSGEKLLWKLALIPAALIAFSRMYLYVHYPTDILGGTLLGCLCGYMAYRLAKGLHMEKKQVK